MSEATTTIRARMTAAPHTIGMEQTISTAARLMRDHRVRHLPVLHGGQVVGMLSERDVAVVEALDDVDPEVVTVEEAMSGSPYVVDADADVGEVAATMAAHKYGSAIVVAKNRVAGIFTTVDACRLLAELLAARRD